MRNFITSLIASVLILTACASHRGPIVTGNTDSLAGLKAMGGCCEKRTSQNKRNLSKIREMAIKETALSLGAQSGLAHRAKSIDEELTKQDSRLEQIFDFHQLILQHNILPPVLLEGRNTLNLADAQTIRLSDRTYKVIKQAHFITTPPHWRQYLWMDYKQPEVPHISLLPKNRIEKEMWNYYVTKGWKKGIEQANTIFEENIARIREDMTGMIIYRKLLAMNMVSAPFVSNTDLGVTGDGGEIHIDDRVLRITVMPELNTNSSEWRAAVAKEENRLEKLTQMEKSIQEANVTLTNDAWQPTITPAN